MKASKSRSQGRKFFAIIFRHPVKKDSKGKQSLKIRRGLGTSDSIKADNLVRQMNDILSDSFFWDINAKSVAEKLYDPIIVSAFYDALETKTDKFIIVYESGLGKGWDIIEGIDLKDALEKFKKQEPDIYKLCRYPYGEIHIAKKYEIDIRNVDKNFSSMDG